MAIKCKEVRSENVKSSVEPTPAFQDKNVTIYSFPVSSSPPSSGGAEDSATFEPMSSLKRKRSSSPHVPSKRPLHPASLSELMRDSSFTPRDLSGALADEYRLRLVTASFLGKYEPSSTDLDYIAPPRQPREKKVSKPPIAEPLVVEPTGVLPIRPPLPPRPGRLAGFPRLLPRLPPSIRTDPVALGYVLVGPRVRGKFDGAKAKALGLPSGPVRAKLAGGQAVVCVVNDGKGGKVEREVRPEELVGESERPIVSF